MSEANHHLAEDENRRKSNGQGQGPKSCGLQADGLVHCSGTLGLREHIDWLPGDLGEVPLEVGHRRVAVFQHGDRIDQSFVTADVVAVALIERSGRLHLPGKERIFCNTDHSDLHVGRGIRPRDPVDQVQVERVAHIDAFTMYRRIDRHLIGSVLVSHPPL